MENGDVCMWKRLACRVGSRVPKGGTRDSVCIRDAVSTFFSALQMVWDPALCFRSNPRCVPLVPGYFDAMKAVCEIHRASVIK